MAVDPNAEREKLGHAVSDDGTVNYLSVTQLKTFVDCPRKWFYNKRLHIPEPRRVFTDLGVKVHSQLEHYAKTGEDVLGPIARAGKHLLPAPGKDLLVEQHFGKPTPIKSAGVPFVGYIDLVVPRDPKHILVIDHKTSSDPEKWGLSAEELAVDVQKLAYSEWARLHFPTAEKITSTWIYYATRGQPRAIPVPVTTHVDVVAEQWLTVKPVVETLIQVAKETDPDKVEAKVSACDAYGGCAYRDRCSVFSRNVFDAIDFSKVETNVEPERKQGMSILKRTLGATGAVVPTISGAATVATPPPPAPAAPTPPPATSKLLIEEVPSDPRVGKWYKTPLGAAEYQGQTSKDKALFDNKAGSRFELGTLEGLEEVAKTVEEPAATPASEEPAKRKRRTKAEMEAAKAAEVAPPTPPPAPEAPAAPIEIRIPIESQLVKNAEAAAPDASEELAGRTLYIGCRPSTPHGDLTSYVNALHQGLATKFKLADIRLGDSQHPLGFGKWKGFLASEVRANPPASHECVIYPGELNDVVIEALTPMCKKVVR